MMIRNTNAPVMVKDVSDMLTTFTKKHFFETFGQCERLTAEKVNDIMAHLKYRNGSASEHYQRPTNSRQIAITVGATTYYVGEPASFGNSKIACSCLVTKLLPWLTCPECSGCIGSCYAMKAAIAYPSTFVIELLYTFLAQNRPVEYVAILDGLISRFNPRFIRLHESGDFFSVPYAKAINDLALRHPGTSFYTYSKTVFGKYLTARNINIVSSLILVEKTTDGFKLVSVDAKQGQGSIVDPVELGDRDPRDVLKGAPTGSRFLFVNYGFPSTVKFLQELTGAWVCKCETDHTVKCMGNCCKCAFEKLVLFLIH